MYTYIQVLLRNFCRQSLDYLHEIWTMSSVVTKLHTIEECKHPLGFLVAGNKTEFTF